MFVHFYSDVCCQGATLIHYCIKKFGLAKQSWTHTAIYHFHLVEQSSPNIETLWNLVEVLAFPEDQRLLKHQRGTNKPVCIITCAFNIYRRRRCFGVCSVDPNDQKKTACYDIDVEVEDPLKAQMSNFLLSTANQQEIASLDNKVTNTIPHPHLHSQHCTSAAITQRS